MSDSTQPSVVEALECLEMCRDLMLEAKSHEGPKGGPITDHLDDAENWLDKVRAHIEALAAQPRDDVRVVIFFREEGFYPIQLSGLKPAAEEIPEHVALNPGTLRVEDTQGNVLWSKGLKQH